MSTLLVKQILSDQILVSRESARELQGALEKMVSGNRSEQIVVDFAGVAGIAPSFLDELLTVFESLVDGRNGIHIELVVANPPMRLSSKFEAVARGHRMAVRPREDGAWVLAPAA